MTKGPDPSKQSVSSQRDSAFLELESARAALRSLAAWGKEIHQHLQLPEPTETMTRAVGTWAREIQGVFGTISTDLQQSLATLEADYAEFVDSEDIQNLIRHGWFLDPGLSFREIVQLAEAFSADPEQAHEALRARFRDRVDDIEVEVSSAFPNRSEILQDAFQAHRDGQYNLSVPVFLTQADGFFHDRLTKSLFLRRDRDDVARHIEEVADRLSRSLSQALSYDRWPLVEPWGQRQQHPDGFTELNRHAVLHGAVTDYGTEENSLKAISLLNFCAFVLPKPEYEATDANGSE